MRGIGCHCAARSTGWPAPFPGSHPVRDRAQTLRHPTRPEGHMERMADYPGVTSRCSSTQTIPRLVMVKWSRRAWA